MNQYTVLKVSNPSSEDFTFRWDQIDYVIEAGGYLRLPQFLAEHASLKLARKIVQAKYGGALKAIRDHAEEVNSLIKEIVTLDSKPEDSNMTAGEKLRAEVLQINEEAIPNEFKNEDGTDKKKEEVSREEVLKENNPVGYRAEQLSKMTRQELMKTAKDRGIEVTSKSTKDELVDNILDVEF